MPGSSKREPDQHIFCALLLEGAVIPLPIELE